MIINPIIKRYKIRPNINILLIICIIIFNLISLLFLFNKYLIFLAQVENPVPRAERFQYIPI